MLWGGSRGVDSETELGWLGGNLELNLWVWCSFALVSDRRWVITTRRGNKSKLDDRFPKMTEVSLTSDLVESPLTSNCLGNWRIWHVESKAPHHQAIYLNSECLVSDSSCSLMCERGILLFTGNGGAGKVTKPGAPGDEERKRKRTKGVKVLWCSRRREDALRLQRCVQNLL